MKMSIEVNLVTANKKELVELMNSIANLIKASSNKRISAVLSVDFKKAKKDC